MKRTPAALVACGVLLLAGCASDNRATQDAPVDAALKENTAWFIVNGPNQFHNLGLKCLDGDLLVIHTREASPLVVAGASACKPGEAEKIGIPRVKGVSPPAG
jgi:hypothetical protein